MKNIKQLISILSLLLVVNLTANAAQSFVKTMPLGGEISTTGYVRIVVKLTADFTGDDLGIILHQTEEAKSWNDGIATTLCSFTEGGGNFAGYNGAWDKVNEIKLAETSKEIALWFTVDVANNTYGLSAQMEGETTVSTVFSDFTSRSFASSATSQNANFCSVFVNDKNGMATTAIEIVKDAEIVNTIEPYTFDGGEASIAQNQFNDNISIPSIVKNVLSIKSNESLSTVSILTLNGQEVASAINTNQLSVANLSAGMYLVKAVSTNGEVAIRKIIKQ